MAAEIETSSDMTFVDRSVGVRNSAPPDVVSLESGVACAITFQHDLGTDMSRTLYTGAGKFCMPVTDVQLGYFRELSNALARGYTPDPSIALPNAAFDYSFPYQGTRYVGSYQYDGGEDFDHSLAPFDALLRDIVKNGDEVASVNPCFRVSRVGQELVVNFLVENTGRSGVALTGVSEWAADGESPDAEGVVFRLSRGGAPVVVGSLSSDNYSGDSSLLDGPVFIGAGETLSLRFTFLLQDFLAGPLAAGSYLASGSMRVHANFDGGVSGQINTPISPVDVAVSAE